MISSSWRTPTLLALVLGVLLLASGSLVPVLAHAAVAADGTVASPSTAADGTASTPCTTDTAGALKNPLNHICNLQDLVAAILDAVVNIGAILLVFMLVYVGFQFVVAQGNEEKIKSARQALIWTVIGGLILLGAKAISIVIQTTVSGL